MPHLTIMLLLVTMLTISPKWSMAMESSVPIYTYRILHIYPHDRTAFTQGLIYHKGVFYESTGLWGRSSLRKVKIETGQILQNTPLPDKYFGEGITRWQQEIIQLTWRDGTGWVYDLATLQLLKTFDYEIEGWGITQDGEKLIVSDGSSYLYFWSPKTFQKVGAIQVQYQGQPVSRLNELEYIKGEIFANIWLTDYIAQISPQTGAVLGWINLTGLNPLPPALVGTSAVLNGIAYDKGNNRLFVTGKLWPSVFEIKLIPCLPEENKSNCQPPS